MIVRQGEIYGAYVGGGALRPVVVVSRAELNRGHYVLCVPFTSQRVELRSRMPNYVPFEEGEYGLTKDCVAQSEAITLLRKTDMDMDKGPRGTLDGDRLRDLIRAIGYVIDADCEPI